MGVLVVIPARYGSVRFPGKPLALLQGKPMIQHVYERAVGASRVDEVIVATDDPRIIEVVERFGGRAAMTNATACSGTERVAEVAGKHDARVVINVQGDEPLIQSEMVAELAGYLEAHEAVVMASLMTKLQKPEVLGSPHVVKVVVDRDGFALYFSRATIPYVREDQLGSGLRAQGSRQEPQPSAPSPQPPAYFKHLGIYGYQRHFLLQFPHLEPTPLERLEQLEQLRALEHGYRIKLLETPYDTIGVDTPEDLTAAERLLAAAEQPATRRA